MEATLDKELIKKRREELRALGITLRDFCRQRDISYQSARDLMSGRSKGSRFGAHKAAVALGLKPDPAKLGLTLDSIGA